MCVFTPPVSPFRADTPLTSAGGKGAVRRFKQLDKLKFDNMRRIVLQFSKKNWEAVPWKLWAMRFKLSRSPSR